MITNQSTKRLLTINALLIMIVSCASTEPRYDRNVDDAGTPKWVVQGTHTSKTERGRSFLGVGVAPTNGEFSRQASAANLRAKDELERMVERFIEVVSREYISSGTAQPSGFLENEAPQRIIEMTSIVIPNAQIMEHWVDDEGDKIFAIAEIDYSQVISLLSSSSKVNSGFKGYLKSSGEQVFDRIARQY